MRIGIDLGGSKIEAVVMDEDSSIRQCLRVPTPSGGYAATLAAVQQLVRQLERDVGRTGLNVGIGTPGSISPASGVP